MAKCPYCNNDCEEYYVETMITVCPECESKSMELTNEEWLNSLSINERADEIIGYIANTIGLARYYNDDDVAEFVKWLKEKHDER